MTTPISVAFIWESKITEKVWDVYNDMIDILFVMDIFIIFNTALRLEDLSVIDSRKTIAKTYITGWFTIDLLAILPFDLIMQGLDMNHLVKLTRISRLYKLFKLAKLIRLFKFFKN